MAIRTLITALLMLLSASVAQACFGPKLFLGIPDDPRGRSLTALVSIYIQEKTGIETERVSLQGKNALNEIRGDRLDYGFSSERVNGLHAVLEIEGLPILYSGPRILEDLQFTTVAPALKRLQKLLEPEHLDVIVSEISRGEVPMAAARRFLMDKRWI